MSRYTPRKASDAFPSEGFLAKLDRIAAEAEERVDEHGLVLDDNARRVLRLGVLFAITDKGE